VQTLVSDIRHARVGSLTTIDTLLVLSSYTSSVVSYSVAASIRSGATHHIVRASIHRQCTDSLAIDESVQIEDASYYT
jgi:hypothetical protein